MKWEFLKFETRKYANGFLKVYAESQRQEKLSFALKPSTMKFINKITRNMIVMFFANTNRILFMKKWLTVKH